MDDPRPVTVGSDLARQRAVVTGAAHGIGLAIARRLTSLGATVIAVDRDEGGLSEAFSTGDCIPVVADISTEGALRLGKQLAREHGPIQVIVNNVGITSPSGFLGLEARDFDMVFRTNLRGPWFLTRELVRSLIGSGDGGSVLFVSSVHDTHLRLHPHYSASKAAIAMLVRELAYELAPHGIRVNALSPGWIRTKDVDTEPSRRFIERIPAGRPGEPDDVARMAIVLLSSEWSSYVTGANFVVDGGLSLHSWMMDL